VNRSITLIGQPEVVQIAGLMMIGIVFARGVLAAGIDYRQSGHDHFYNLEYDQAIVDFTKVIEQNPADPNSYNDLASAELYKELCRLGLLNSAALGRDNRFLRDRPAQVDERFKTKFLDAVDRGRRLAEDIVAHNRRNEVALYALCKDYALRATYEFMLDKSWLSALRSGSQARGYCEELRKINPRFIDAYLVLGGFEYVTGSLPWPVKLLAAVGGLHGSKSKGLEYITCVADRGKYDRDAARVLLTVLWRREKRPQQAAQILEALMRDYARNYLFGLELARVYSDADRPDHALTVLKTVMQKGTENGTSHQRLLREIVQMQIDALEAKLSVWHPGNPTRVWP
jgi:tetratricopeptide (TPR) repeat protein